ncbi:sugar ABC transporter ATP-binding protein [Ornithinimicrobium cavernae]|uniref:sugar ABC transporter ATP-binding protein n=1 Tax=Ornithinimicrobium cavernae TaxID=2666047 RepID=UPI00192A5AF8|nr:sugar ABC transporter ATP-binding protein [Ornithinimicrobium cavernae]
MQDDATTDPAGALRLEGITKDFGPNRVLKGVTMDLRAGRVTALLGANGAGKSTLIKILSGIYERQDGRILVSGQAVDISTPMTAAQHGIQTVHQRIDDSIIPDLTVAENLVFEEMVRGSGPRVRTLKSLLPRAREIAQTLDLEWSDNFLLKDAFEIGIADGQLLLLARALNHRPKVLILDEPTSTLSATETDRLFTLVRRLRDEGVAIMYVTHRLSEVRTLADDLVVLRDGRLQQEQSAPFDMPAAVEAMLGKTIQVEVSELTEHRGERVALELRGIQLLPRSAPIDLDLRYGEVTGVIGLIGAGKTELAQAVFGAERLRAGSMRLDGAEFAPRSTRDAVRRGIYLAPEDRAAQAMLLGWTVATTGSLPFLAKISRGSVVNRRAERRMAADIINDYGVVATGPDQEMDALSGGNQQKVVVARWLRQSPRIMLLDEPFRGVDLGARRDLAHKAREQAEAGACVVVLVSDVEELREVADRVVVLAEGQTYLDAYASEIDNSTIIASMSEVA